MSNIFRFALIPLFLCLAMLLPARGRKEAQYTAVQNTVVQISGRVRLVGTALFPNLVITGPEHEWYIDSEEMYKLADMQHLTVTVEGTETVVQLTFANGLPAGERRTLRDVKIIEIDLDE
jgi:hypothetical protein